MNEYTKNVIIAAGLSMLFIAGWDYFYAFPKLEKERQAQLEQQKTAPTQKPATPQAGRAPEARAPETKQQAPATEPQQQRPAVVAQKPVQKTREATLAESPRIAIDTPSIAGSIALKGGRIDDASLKNYRETVDPKSPIILLLSPENSPNPYYTETGFLAAAGDGAVVAPNGETLWTADRSELTPTQPVTLTYDNGQGLTFKRKISVDDRYMFTILESVENHGDKSVTLYPYSRIVRLGFPESTTEAALHEGFVGVLGEGGAERHKYDAVEKTPGGVKLKGPVGWVGISDKYWGAVLVPDQGKNLEARFAVMGSGTTKAYQADTVETPVSVAPGATGAVSSRIFAGAKVVDVLDVYEDQGIRLFDRLIDWGWLQFLTRPMFRFIDGLYHVLGNFGLAILAVTVLVKIAFLPLANKSYQAMAKMKEMQPKIAALKEKYKDDKHKLNTEQMELFKREKVNPAGGCVPMLLQIPVFIALYNSLLITIEMRHAPFYGWIKDLSAPDPTNIFNLFGLLPFDPTHIPVVGSFLWLGVWPLIMGVSMWATMKMNPEPTDEIQRMAFAWMPVIFTFSLGSFASGLVIYWTWNNILSVTQQWYIMRRAGVKFELWDNLKKTFSFKKAT